MNTEKKHSREKWFYSFSKAINIVSIIKKHINS